MDYYLINVEHEEMKKVFLSNTISVTKGKSCYKPMLQEHIPL